MLMTLYLDQFLRDKGKHEIKIGEYEAMADVTEQLLWFGGYMAHSMRVFLESGRYDKNDKTEYVCATISGAEWLYIVNTFSDPKERIEFLVSGDEIPF